MLAAARSAALMALSLVLLVHHGHAALGKPAAPRGSASAWPRRIAHHTIRGRATMMEAVGEVGTAGGGGGTRTKGWFAGKGQSPCVYRLPSIAPLPMCPNLQNHMCIIHALLYAVAHATCCVDSCRQHGSKHVFLGFIDFDEFLIFIDHNITHVEQLLRPYEQYGGLAVHWVLVGPSNHSERPNGAVIDRCVMSMRCMRPRTAARGATDCCCCWPDVHGRGPPRLGAGVRGAWHGMVASVVPSVTHYPHLREGVCHHAACCPVLHPRFVS